MSVTEKVLVGGVKVAQRTLQGLGVDFRKLLILSLQFAPHAIDHLNIANRFLFLLVGFNLQVECPIIDKAAAAESLGKQNLLFFCRIDSIFIGSQHGDFI